MDRSVLLLLFDVQVFLLIAAFGSADAAAVLNNDGQDYQPFLQRLGNIQGMNNRPISRFYRPRCSDYPGGCGLVGLLGLPEEVERTIKGPTWRKDDQEKPTPGPPDFIVPQPRGEH